MQKKNIELKHQHGEDEVWRLILPSAVELGFSCGIALNLSQIVFVVVFLFFSFFFSFYPGEDIELKKHIMTKLLITF